MRPGLPASTTRFADTESVSVGSAVSTGVDESFCDSFANQKPTASGDAETLGELLSELAATYPELEGKLIENGEIAGSTVVTRNKKDVRHLDGPSTQLSDGDVIRLTPSVYGG